MTKITSFSKSNITFLSEQITNKNLYKIGYYHFYKIQDLNLNSIIKFLLLLDANKAYIILPLLTVEDNISSPILSLSRQILVTKESDPLIILNFILKQIISLLTN